MNDEAIPESDQLPGAPHPRDAVQVFGQDEAEQAFLDAWNTGRLAHAWLITGPRGIGKASLAWRMARFLLARPASDTKATTLDVPPDDPVARRMRAGSEARLFQLRRPWDPEKKRLKTEITVEEARRLKSFFALSSTDGGYRAVIVDPAEEMNVSTANAVLKLLEEPPARSLLFLVSHSPARLLPTIRSRCRGLRCKPLQPADLTAALAQAGISEDAPPALAELAGGSAGHAIGLISEGGVDLYASLVSLVSDAPSMDRKALERLADSASGAKNTARRDLILNLIDLLLSRMARSGVDAGALTEAAPGETALFARLVPDAGAARDWARLQQELSDRASHGIAVNLDPSSIILDMVLKLNEMAGQIQARP